MSYQHHSDEALVTLLTQSDERAFEEVYLRHWQRIYRFALSRISSQEAVEDICHEIFLSVWQRRSVLQINNLEAYLTQSAKYAVSGYYKSKFSDEKHLSIYAGSLAGAHNGTDDLLFFNNLQKAWLTALQVLPEKTKAVFQYSRMDHMSNRDIAARLQLTEKAVEYHITKALKQIKAELKEFFVLLLLFSEIFL